MPILNAPDPQNDVINGATTNVSKVATGIAAAVGVLGPVVIKVLGKPQADNENAFLFSTAIIVAAALFTVALVYSVDVFSRATASAAKSAATATAPIASTDIAQPIISTPSHNPQDKAPNIVAVSVEPFEVGFTGELGRYQVRMILVDTASRAVQYYVQAQGCAPAWVDGANVTK